MTVLHIDAHSDLYDEFDGDRFSHACPFARVMEDRLAGRLIQVGIRTMNPHQRDQARRFGVEVIDMRTWLSGARPRVEGEIYLSLDLDGPYRLILVPSHNPVPMRTGGGMDWSQITAVTVLGIEDTHE